MDETTGRVKVVALEHGAPMGNDPYFWDLSGFDTVSLARLIATSKKVTVDKGDGIIITYEMEMKEGSE